MPRQIWQHGGSRGRDKKVIGKATRQSTQGPHPAGPWVKNVRDQRHAEWPPLGDAAGVVVSNTKSPSNGVVILAAGVNIFIGKPGAGREPPNAAKFNEKHTLQLVEEFKTVGGATCSVLTSEFGILQVNAIHLPRIFSTNCLRGTSEHGLIFP